MDERKVNKYLLYRQRPKQKPSLQDANSYLTPPFFLLYVAVILTINGEVNDIMIPKI